MSRWYWLTRRWSGDSVGGSATCPHCGRQLQVCPSCLGSYDSGRLCQQCMSGTVCPACQRYWTWN
jgi:hypothetical protein